MTSLQISMNAVSFPTSSNGGTTANCEGSPSPVSPTTRNEKSSRSARSFRTRFGCSFPTLRWISIQRRRSLLVGSPRRLPTIWLRDLQRGARLSQEKGLLLADIRPLNLPTSLQVQPAPASESREDPPTGPTCVSSVQVLPVTRSCSPARARPCSPSLAIIFSLSVKGSAAGHRSWQVPQGLAEDR